MDKEEDRPHGGAGVCMWLIRGAGGDHKGLIDEQVGAGTWRSLRKGSTSVLWSTLTRVPDLRRFRQAASPLDTSHHLAHTHTHTQPRPLVNPWPVNAPVQPATMVVRAMYPPPRHATPG